MSNKLHTNLKQSGRPVAQLRSFPDLVGWLVCFENNCLTTSTLSILYLHSIADRVFESFRNVLLSQETVRENVLESQAMLLLVYFNHIHGLIQVVADNYISKLVDKFPHLLWNRRVLWCMLDILQLLAYSLTLNPNEETPTLPVNGTPYVLQLMDSLVAREKCQKDFAARCQGIVTEAMKWAPKSTRSHLQEYPNNVMAPALSSHSGLALAFDSILHTTMMATKKPSAISSDTSRFVSVLCLRSKYAGEISGLLSVLEDDDKRGLADRLVNDVWEACKKGSDAQHRGALWRATAYLILCSGVNRKLLHAIGKRGDRGFPVKIAIKLPEIFLCSLVPSRVVHAECYRDGGRVLAMGAYSSPRSGDVLHTGDDKCLADHIREEAGHFRERGRRYEPVGRLRGLYANPETGSGGAAHHLVASTVRDGRHG